MAKALHNKVDRRILKERMRTSGESRTTISFYKYVQLPNPRFFRNFLYLHFDELKVLGRIYVAHEGVNAQISVPDNQLESFKNFMDTITFFQGIRLNKAIDEGKSFFKLTIKVKDKIVADGLDDASFDVSKRGKHLKADEVNKMMEETNSVFVDMRNHYEHEVGHFEGAILPDVETFREELDIVEDLLAENKHDNIVMYCTGGIRCEKASAYFLHKGFENVYMVDGGIIEYARQVKNQNLESKFVGKNFVFDERLGERITEDVIARCHQCDAVCDTHVNCANDNCHILFIQCDQCAEKYNHCCSKKCKSYSALDEQTKQHYQGKVKFNGTQYGKARYNSLSKDEFLPHWNELD